MPEVTRGRPTGETLPKPRAPDLCAHDPALRSCAATSAEGGCQLPCAGSPASPTCVATGCRRCVAFRGSGAASHCDPVVMPHERRPGCADFGRYERWSLTLAPGRRRSPSASEGCVAGDLVGRPGLDPGMLGPALGGSTPSVTIRLRSSAAVLSSPPFAEVLEGPTSAGALSSDLVDVEESLETAEVLPVAGEEREILGAGGCRDQEVDSPGAASLPTRRSHGRKDPSVRACRVGVERQRIERCLGPLQSVLAATTLLRVTGGVWPRRELGHGDGADREL